MLVCPWHAWEFDCKTGENDYNPSIRQRRFVVTLQGDDILVDID
jgi:nitrite reductase/ring-hydroxylating ferredoxin subunit